MKEKPAFNYFGSKWNIAPQIIKHFPPHKHYVDACGGSAAVLLRKRPSAIETFNDLDSNVVNFFRVLRVRPGELIHLLELTPYARAELDNARLPTSDPIEAARRFFVSCIDSRDHIPGESKSGFRKITKFDWNFASPATATRLKVANLANVARRFMQVQIENIDAMTLADRTNHPNTRFYYDPPYLAETRVSKKMYNLEMSHNNHISAALVLTQLDSMVIISGYNSELYADLYADWQRVDIEAETQAHVKRTESLWLSPATVAALNRPKQMELSL